MAMKQLCIGARRSDRYDRKYYGLGGTNCGSVTDIFYISRPLTNEEVAALAALRRSKDIRAYYSFDNREYTANPSFKKMMNSNGQMYVVNDPLWKFSAIAAAHSLKGRNTNG